MHRWTKRRQQNFYKLLIGLAMVALGAYAVASGVVSLLDSNQRIVTPNGIISVETVQEPEDRIMGLSGRDSLGPNEGMLFIFDESSRENCFWMKDMKISIDMIWLNDKKEVVTIKSKVTPETYPESFCPDDPAVYGLEIAENRAEQLGVEVGTKLRW